MKNKEISHTIVLALIVTVLFLNLISSVTLASDGQSVSPKILSTNMSTNENVSASEKMNNMVTTTVPVGNYPYGVAVNPNGTKVYVANQNSNTVSVIDTATNNVTATVNTGIGPQGIAVNPNGSRVYVTNGGSNNVSVIDTNNKQCYSYGKCRNQSLWSCSKPWWKKGYM